MTLELTSLKLIEKMKNFKPNFLGVKIIDNLDLNILKDYIDWSPF